MKSHFRLLIGIAAIATLFLSGRYAIVPISAIQIRKGASHEADI